MKTVFFTGLACLLAMAACAQKETKGKEHVVVPVLVIIAFNKQFPHSKNIRWEMEKNDYEVHFDFGGKQESAVFHPSGKLMETEVEIATKDLPKDAMAYLDKHYHGKKIKEAALITDLNGKKMYEAKINGKDILFDTTGHFIK